MPALSHRCGRRNRFSLLLIPLILLMIWLIRTHTAKHYLVNISYLTRPFWDRPAKKFEIIDHYNAGNLSMQQLCNLHNWTIAETASKVYDATLFSVELDLLEIRLKELYDVVDKFLIIESNSTFTGLPKELIYLNNQDRFSFAQDKIIYKSITVPPLASGGDPFVLEAMHRVAMNELIKNAGAETNDWILMTDVDEIPSYDTVKLLKYCSNVPSPIHLQLRNYIYSFEFLVDMNSWRGKAVRYPFGYGHSRSSDYMLADAGWHCSFCFKYIRDFEFKMLGYSHADRVHSKSMLGRDRIQKVICEGSDIFDMLPEAYNYKDLLYKWGPMGKQTSGLHLPKHVLSEPLKFAFLLPGGCKRDYK